VKRLSPKGSPGWGRPFTGRNGRTFAQHKAETSVRGKWGSRMSTVLTTRERDRIDAYWRAANHLSAGQIYLHDNPLLREPLSMPACTAWPPAKSAYPTIEIWWKGNFVPRATSMPLWSIGSTRVVRL